MAIPYDAEKHLLLCDQAHKRRIDVDTPEYSDYLTRLRDYQYDPFREDKRLELFQVQISEWPPVKRSPLQMMFGVKVGGGGEPVDLDPFGDKPWKGVQWAVERNFWTQRGTMELAKEMVPLDENDDPRRMAYQWQCAIFDPQQHVVIRYWCKENGVDIVEFYKEFLPAHPDLQIIETTNPQLLDEQANGGSYSLLDGVFRLRSCLSWHSSPAKPFPLLRMAPRDRSPQRLPGLPSLMQRAKPPLRI